MREKAAPLDRGKGRRIMKIAFKNLSFDIVDGRVLLKKCGTFVSATGMGIAEVQIAGENKFSHLGVKAVRSSEGARLRYVSHTYDENTLCIVQESPLVRVSVFFTAYGDSNAVRVHTEVKNITRAEITLEEVSAFVACGLEGEKRMPADRLYFTRFTQSHHNECRPIRASFSDLGLFHETWGAQKRIAFANAGSWSTKEELPQGVIENAETGATTLFQIESSAFWYYEISDVDGKYYLWLGSANGTFCGWQKTLAAGESYRTVAVALSFGKSFGEAAENMTKYRRHIAGECSADENLPPIFNEYMHLSWDNPNEERTRKLAPKIAETGVKYYVIDCGWHDEVPANKIYANVGEWKESALRFPHGIRATTDYIRSLGMKAGLWIEPEVVGIDNRKTVEFYGDECFLKRHGKKIAVMDRYFLDFRVKKVRDTMSETIRRMVEDYGADYIKFDYNQDLGIGADGEEGSFGSNLESAADAYLQWADEMRAKFPQVIFETCASGGMRMDYKTLSHFSLISTSDQTNYLKYAYIAANVLSAVLPEQAAVWSYPVDSFGEPNTPFEPTEAWVEANISRERVVFNMINAFLGRMHLASHLELLSAEKFSLVKEGVAYYERLVEIKKSALPYFPKGLCSFGDKEVTCGLKDGNKIYLAVWNLSDEEREIAVPINADIKRAEIAYPAFANNEVSFKNGELKTRLDGKTARFFEIEIQS